MFLSTTFTLFLNTSRDGESNTCLDSLFQSVPDHSFGELYSIIQPEPPLVHLEALTSCPFAVTWQKRLTPTSLQPSLSHVLGRPKILPFNPNKNSIN